LHIPVLEPLARGFGLEYSRLDSLEEVPRLLEKHAQVHRPRLIECQIDRGQLREPRLVSKLINGKFQTPALDDMTPPLPEKLAKAVARLLKRS
jgi:thiamine pyrophosphate-dependent acetolactate synthase large subunit-like protein